jgi:hypothetical protein
MSAGRQKQSSTGQTTQRSETDSSQSSRPTTPGELAGYWGQLSALSGGQTQRYAQTPMQVNYDPLTPGQLSAMGGAGQTRRLGAERAFEDLMQRTGADPRLSVFQRQYAGEQGAREYASNLDAINAESEAALTELAAANRAMQMKAQTEQGQLNNQQIANLIDMFFRGQGQVSQQQSTTRSSTDQSNSSSGNDWRFAL